MTFDFCITANVVETGKQEDISSKATYYTISMLDVSNNEIPMITDNLAVLYNQTIALLGTINKGQLVDYPDFGFTPLFKIYSLSDHVYKNIYTANLLGELQDMMSEFFMANTEILNYAMENYSEVVIVKGS